MTSVPDKISPTLINALLESIITLVLLLVLPVANATGEFVMFTLNTGVALPVNVSDVNAQELEVVTPSYVPKINLLCGTVKCIILVLEIPKECANALVVDSATLIFDVESRSPPI